MYRIPSKFLSLAFAAFMLCHAATSSAYVTDSNVRRPDNYYGFWPPSAGQSYTDSNFGTTVTRMSNASGTSNAGGSGSPEFIGSEYSTMSAFNADNSRILLIEQSYFAVYDGAGNRIKALYGSVDSSSEPRWSRTDPNTFYYHSGNQLMAYNVSTDSKRVVHTFSEYSSISGQGEMDMSYDGDHLVLSGDGRYVFVYTISADRKGPVFDATSAGSWDSIYISPNNNVLISWHANGSGRYQGQELYDQNMNFLRQVTRANGHKRMTRDSDGSEVLIWTNSNDPQPINCRNGIVKVNLATTNQTCLLELDWSLAVHISAADQNGFAYVETYNPSDISPDSSSWVTYTNEFLMVRLDGGEVRRLLHHRSRPYDGYSFQPKISVSRDGSRFVFSSNYGINQSGGVYTDAYLGVISGSTGSSAMPAPSSPGSSPSAPAPVEIDAAPGPAPDAPAPCYPGVWWAPCPSGN